VKWLGLGAGEEGELQKVKQTTINKRIFIKIEVCVRKSKVMALGSERGSSTDGTDVALRWKKMIQIVGFARYVTEQSFVCSIY